MSQLRTLIWLKWTLLRNSLRSPKAIINRVASVVGMLAALAMALLVAIGLGVAAYALTAPHGIADVLQRKGRNAPGVSAEFVFFSILAFLYLMWATVPLSIGSSRQFDPGRMLIYPISLRKLFAIDLFSEITSLQSIFALPAIVALAVGAGLGRGDLMSAVIVILPMAAFGMALSKWLSTSIAALVRRRRTRGETVLALIGAVAGLGGALAGQVAPVIFKHAESFRSFRWTPPGAAAFALATSSGKDPLGYALALLALSAYATILILATYWIARRAALGMGGAKRRRDRKSAADTQQTYTGWHVPFVSPELSAIVEKELRYVLRNAQLRMMALMPLILIVVRLTNTRRFGSGRAPQTPPAFGRDFFSFGEGLMASSGVLYVFLILAGLACNLFAFEEGGMRTLILSPVDRRKILMGKNLTITIVALIFSLALLTINEIVFSDLTAGSLVFAALSFVTFAALMSVMGNWLSVRFPKRMKFGKRLNVSGIVGLLLIPMLLVMAFAPLSAVAAGYVTRSFVVEYATLGAFAILALALYVGVMNAQAHSLEMREVDILETVREPSAD